MVSYIRAAGLTVALCHEHDYLRRLCRGYLVPPTAAPDLTLSLSADELAAEAAAPGGLRGTPGYVESLCLYRKLADLLPTFGVLVFHAAVVCLDGVGYAFSGPSGVGKSTHARLWAEHFGASFINGDKPFLRFADGRVRACGTPWAGKEGRQSNIEVPLGGICFLRQAKDNRIRRLPPDEGAPLLLRQSLVPRGAEAAAAWLARMDDVARAVPLWELCCDVSREAAEMSRAAMTGGDPGSFQSGF